MSVSWLWGTRRSVVLKAAGIGLVALVSVGGAALGALNPPPAAQNQPAAPPAIGAAAALSEAAGAASPAHGLAGAVLGRQGDRLLVRSNAGKLGSVCITAETVVRRGKQTASAAAIRQGDQIAAVGVPQPNAKPPCMDAKVIILRPPRLEGAAPAGGGG